MGIALAHEIDLSAIRLESDEAQFLLDWIVCHGGVERLESWLREEFDDDECKAPTCVSGGIGCGTYMNDIPVITEDSLRRLLLGFHVESGYQIVEDDGNRELFKALDIPFPTDEQRKDRVLPHGFRRTGYVSFGGCVYPINKDMKERIARNLIEGDVCNIKVEYIEKKEVR